MYDDVLKKIESEEDLNREQMVLLYVIKCLDDLRHMGIITGGRYEMSKKGREVLGDFKATNEELEECLLMMRNGGLL